MTCAHSIFSESASCVKKSGKTERYKSCPTLLIKTFVAFLSKVFLIIDLYASTIADIEELT